MFTHVLHSMSMMMINVKCLSSHACITFATLGDLFPIHKELVTMYFRIASKLHTCLEQHSAFSSTCPLLPPLINTIAGYPSTPGIQILK